ncbi:proton-coupled amino acid transporter-like protein CG1139 [Bombyx mandarina]|uniref:Amino acid transporter transmembrane domain-containing protein n=2 Tax=Bombyx TaxID=7090 RepID=A0A8R2ALI2_BOMMO|nr:proton-coupled amino acid transporter-like protein CG1139 [Bombyx mori]XP_028026761.1 proton-coupled amino acid transporter-like protein CG1139 [Bombyx mandarina]
MFIYKFMGGIVETITGGDEEASYDPHLHRKIEKPTSYSETMIHLLKGSIGAGILAMPEAVRRVGIFASIAGLLLVGFFASYCLQLLIVAQYELCKRWRRGYMAYPKSMRLALQDGPHCLRWSSGLLYYFVDVVLILWQLGICVIYPVFVAENIKQVCDSYNLELGLRTHLCCILGPLIIVSMVKDLKVMTPFSSVSNVITILGLILVFFYMIEEDLSFEKEKMEVKSYADIPVFVGVTLFALEAVGVVLALEYNMENPKHFCGIFGLFNIGMMIIIALYLMVGVFGYVKYGDEIKASITLNLPQNEKKAQAAKLIFALSIFLSFPLQNFVAYNIIWRRLKKKITGKKKCPIDYALRILLVLVPWALAIAVPQLGPFISLFGALCLSLLAVVFPGLIDVCIWYPDRYGLCYYKLLRDVFIIIAGLVCLVSGSYSSMIEIVNNMK